MCLHHNLAASPSPLTGGFNTLAQLTPNPQADLSKRARRKAITSILCGKLIELNGPNTQAYRNMYYCNSVLKQDGQELTGSYCKNRFCLVCNSIKTANLINGYLPELKKMKEPVFLTLTIKAVYAPQLSGAIDKMQTDFRAIIKHLRKDRHIKVLGMRKLECNHNKYFDCFDPDPRHKAKYQNPYYDTYNPHYHVVVDGFYQAECLMNCWLDRYPNADPRAQDIRYADDETFCELFKYFSKLIGKNGIINASALDTIYSAFRGRRVVQPLGIRKFIDEDAREKTLYENLNPEETGTWTYEPEVFDWINIKTGECLSGFVPDDEILDLLHQYRH